MDQEEPKVQQHGSDVIPASGQQAPLHDSSGLKLKIMSLLLVLFTGLAGGFVGSWLQDEYSQKDNLVSSNLKQERKLVTSESALFADIAKRLGPSVVSINVRGSRPVEDFFGFVQPQQTAAAGTGIILSANGLVITNRHVVPSGTTSVSVTLADGTELKDVRILGRTGPNDNLDIAFLKIHDTKGHKLTPAPLGDSAKVRVGDTVLTIGNALGQFQNTVTSGIISGFGRQVQAGGESGEGAQNLDDLFQTDAAINQGNSGGPLVNLNGEVIGINTAVAGNAQNIGFAIPINDVKGLIGQVIKTGRLQRPYLGVRYIPLTDDIARQYDLDVKRGAFIAPGVDTDQPSVLPKSPAAKAGLREGDVITQIDGVKVDETHSLTTLLNRRAVGDKVRLTIVRSSKTIQLEATLQAAP